MSNHSGAKTVLSICIFIPSQRAASNLNTFLMLIFFTSLVSFFVFLSDCSKTRPPPSHSVAQVTLPPLRHYTCGIDDRIFSFCRSPNFCKFTKLSANGWSTSSTTAGDVLLDTHNPSPPHNTYGNSYLVYSPRSTYKCHSLRALANPKLPP